jgi:hypothetical protein
MYRLAQVPMLPLYSLTYIRVRVTSHTAQAFAKLPKQFRMFNLVCQKFVCMYVCVFVYGHFCGLISQRIWMKLGTKQDDDAYKKR